MKTNAMTESYISDMENLIVSVLGNATDLDLARLSGLSTDKVQELSTTREMVKLNHLIKAKKNTDRNVVSHADELVDQNEVKKVVNA